MGQEAADALHRRAAEWQAFRVQVVEVQQGDVAIGRYSGRRYRSIMRRLRLAQVGRVLIKPARVVAVLGEAPDVIPSGYGFAGLPTHASHIDERPDLQFSAEDDILGYGEMRGEVELLVDQYDTALLGLLDRRRERAATQTSGPR